MTTVSSPSKVHAGVISTILPPEQTPEPASAPNAKSVPRFKLAATKWRTAESKNLTGSGRNVVSRLLLGICSCQWSELLSYEKRRSLGEADSLLRRYSLQMAALSFAGTVLVVVHNDICFDTETLVFYSMVSDCPLGARLLWLNIFISLLFVHRLVLFYHCRSYVQMKEWHLSTRWRAFIESRMFYGFVFELLIAVWQPIPGFQQIFGFGHKVVISLMVFRLYLVIRLIRYFSPAHIHRRRIKSDYETENRGLWADIRVDTVLKTQFYSHTQITIFGAFLIMAISMAYVIYILERQLWVPFAEGDPILGSEWVLLSPAEKRAYQKTVMAYYTNCIWFVTVTATTVGYGDITPQTGSARVAAMASAMAGIITTSLLVSVLTNRLAPTPFQQYVIDYLNRSAIRRKKREAAAIIIQTWWKAFSAEKHLGRGERATRSSILPNELESLKSREAHMKNNGPHDVTDFNGMTRAILAEQMEMRKSMQEMQDTLQRFSHILAASQGQALADKVEEILIPIGKEDKRPPGHKRDSSSRSEESQDAFVFTRKKG